MRTYAMACVLVFGLCVPRLAAATTEPDLRGRMVVDGYTNDFAPDEVIFGLTASGTPEEPPDDSQWGALEDLRQIRITWDSRRLYLAVEATIWGNNIVLAVDAMDGRGLTSMSAINSWRRLFDFSSDFAPDLLACTWDENTAPRLLLHQGGDLVSDNVPGTLFDAHATFFRDNPGTAMEFMIPWSTVFPGLTRDSVVTSGGPPDTLTVLPACAQLHLVGFVTGGPDGVSGPDSAPNNTGGHPTDYLIPVLIDNFAIVPIDQDCDGLADIGVEPRSRVSFHDVTTPTVRTSWGALKVRFR